ncbi:MAG: DUF4338 domain-containing protein [bacterium]|nr:DUF4338 domain-containing protein [bacterium]
MVTPAPPVLVQCGREVTAQDVEHLKAVVSLCSGLSREELAHTVCEHWGWVTASGGHKVQACLKLLAKLEAQGQLLLPEKRPWGNQQLRKPEWTERTVPGAPISGSLAELRPVSLELATDRGTKDLWNEYVDRYHYLGYQRPFGFRLRYFVVSDRGPLGCVLLAGAAKSLGVRDVWIGWSEPRRLQNLPWVINNTRFLIFPWVQVPHLASHVLGQLARRVRADWEQRWGYRPVLLETFVDPARYRGISYQAAGWILLGPTTGQGLRRPGRDYETTPKLLYVQPLVRDFREQLCSRQQKGWTSE